MDSILLNRISTFGTIFFLSLAVLLCSCATMIHGHVKDPEELARTLHEAVISLPDLYLKSDDFPAQAVFEYPAQAVFGNVKEDLAKSLNGVKIPLIIYMHGCAGLGTSPYDDIPFLTQNKYAVLAPNSFARNYKPTSCNPLTHTGGLHREVLSYRLAEARYAHEIAKTLPWVNQRNIFMMGFSEGGIATAKYSHGGLAGRIILGWTCNAGWLEYNGLAGPKDEPILAVVASRDPWFIASWNPGHCGEYMASRSNSESVVIDASIHQVHALKEIQKKIIQFLEANRRP
jgi:dienelactone hydrolase